MPTCPIISVQHHRVPLSDPPAAPPPPLQVILRPLILHLEQVETTRHAHRRQAQLQQHDARRPAVKAVGLVLRPQHGAQGHGKGRLGQVGGVRGQHKLQGDVGEGSSKGKEGGGSQAHTSTVLTVGTQALVKELEEREALLPETLGNTAS